MNKPFLLKPSGKDYIWGGQRLNTEFDKKIKLDPLAETWECSTHPDGPSFAASGEFAGLSLLEIIKSHPEFLGSRHKGENTLSILIKFIDASKDLSVQVHPDDEYARKYENGQSGKTEMWYVLDSQENSNIIYGLTKDLSAEKLVNASGNGELLKYLQKIPVRKDDVFFIEPGTIHAIGEGCLIAEIQENSNLTYRIYDYNRTGKDGKKRELHLEKAVNTANLKNMSEPRQPIRVLKYKPGEATELLCRCRYFEVYRMLINTERKQEIHYRADSISYRVLLCVDGSGIIHFENEKLAFRKGDCIFIPADSLDLVIDAKAQFLDVRG